MKCEKTKTFNRHKDLISQAVGNAIKHANEKRAYWDNKIKEQIKD